MVRREKGDTTCGAVAGAGVAPSKRHDGKRPCMEEEEQQQRRHRQQELAFETSDSCSNQTLQFPSWHGHQLLVMELGAKASCDFVASLPSLV
ncbi:hypothetical protein RIF29_31420 [Crotalaria pallida]|uniref:Uncharacterized protein n=1 Tax=Crotalaria pallida TaxID=3830 RepID=A0AAN9HX72_CROPI